MSRRCVFDPSVARLGYLKHVAIMLPALAFVIIALIAGLTYWDISSTTFTTCYPVQYSSDVALCWEGLFGDGPWPVEGWVEFLYYYDVSHTNRTANYQIVCGDSLQGAIDRGKEKYPYMEPIVCGWKPSWIDSGVPVRLFLDGKPWDQFELLAASLGLFSLSTSCFLYSDADIAKKGTVKEVESLLA